MSEIPGRIGFVRPMKAKQMNRAKRRVNGSAVTVQRTVGEVIELVDSLDPSEWWAEIKHNGQRGEFQMSGWWTAIGNWNDGARFSHICDSIPLGTVIDGELMPNDGEGHEVVAHYRAACPHKLKLVAFDVLYIGGSSVMDLPLHERREMLRMLIENIDCPNIELNPVIESGFGDALREALEDGREGIMLKGRQSVYKPGSRSAWLKAKGTETVDVVITDCDAKPTEWRVRPGQTGKDGIHYPEGRHSDPWLAGHVGLSYGFYDQNGMLRRVGSLGVTGPHEEMVKHVGRVAEVTSFGPQFPTGAIQHPTFEKWRDDKLPKDCVFDFSTGDAMPVEDPVETALNLMMEH